MQYEPLDPSFEKRVRESFSRQEFMSYIGATLYAVKPGYCEIHLPYRKELSQQHGFFHGGIVGTIADNVGGYAAFSLMPATASVLTVEYKLNLLAPADGDLLIGQGKVIKSGRTLKVCKCDVKVFKNGIETLCATSLMTTITLEGKSDKKNHKDTKDTKKE
jgi:uncharacterized protein (TIGR00369 family)